MAMHEITAEALKSDPNHEFRCERCKEKLNPKTMTWLEMSTCLVFVKTTEELPEGLESQGCFPFGVACAKRVLKNQSLS